MIKELLSGTDGRWSSARVMALLMTSMFLVYTIVGIVLIFTRPTSEQIEIYLTTFLVLGGATAGVDVSTVLGKRIFENKK